MQRVSGWDTPGRRKILPPSPPRYPLIFSPSEPHGQQDPLGSSHPGVKSSTQQPEGLPKYKLDTIPPLLRTLHGSPVPLAQRPWLMSSFTIVPLQTPLAPPLTSPHLPLSIQKKDPTWIPSLSWFLLLQSLHTFSSFFGMLFPESALPS